MPNNKLKIGILETGRLPDELTDVHGDYPALIRDWLAPFDAETTTYAVVDGAIPNDPTEQDLWVVSGSRHGAYEGHAWIPPLEQFVRDCRDAEQKMFGICFGHQVIAQALGGKVAKSANGWGLGVHEYATHNWPGGTDIALNMYAFHQDQVAQIPDNAKVVASSDFCEYAALWYPGFALTVQGHPEMNSEFVVDLLNLRRDIIKNDDLIQSALATTGDDITSPALAVFLRDNLELI
jgi:GMP synthase-like glutamine amidotransferase